MISRVYTTGSPPACYQIQEEGVSGPHADHSTTHLGVEKSYVLEQSMPGASLFMDPHGPIPAFPFVALTRLCQPLHFCIFFSLRGPLVFKRLNALY